MTTLIYFVDDDTVANQLFKRACKKLGLQCEVFSSAMDCIQQTQIRQPTILLTDLNMPEIDGFELIKTVNRDWPALPVIAITGQSNVERAVKAMRCGASDFLQKPYELEELTACIDRNIQFAEITESHSASSIEDYGMLGESAEMLRVFRMIDKLSKVNCPVVIFGESGSGKELAAKAIHDNGPQSDEPFIAIDCGSLPDSLLESELFGHTKGAFTGADQDRTGLLRAAGHGTLFLDEIGNISNAMQTKLLRVFQENVITPVGSNQSVPINARLICASNRDLAEMVDNGEFRHDLYHRINVITLPIPDLDHRREDIPLLVQHFIAEFSDKYELPARYYSSGHIQAIQKADWKGNIRELRNYVERCFILSEGTTLDGIPIPAQSTVASMQNESLMTLAEIERRHINRVLKEVDGNQNKAAKILGISRTTLWRKINSVGA